MHALVKYNVYVVVFKLIFIDIYIYRFYLTKDIL
jgi:hypothetical protein